MLATVCGYTIDQIDCMTMQDFDLLADYWSSHPPVHLMVAGYLGIKPKAKDKPMAVDELRQLFSGPGWTVH